jgi:hypothetical protein
MMNQLDKLVSRRPTSEIVTMTARYLTAEFGVEPYYQLNDDAGIYQTPLYRAIRYLAQQAPDALDGATLDGRAFRAIIDFVFDRLPADLIADRRRIRHAVHPIADCYDYDGHTPEDVRGDDDLSLRCFIRESLLLAQIDDRDARMNLDSSPEQVRQARAHILMHKKAPI